MSDFENRPVIAEMCLEFLKKYYFRFEPPTGMAETVSPEPPPLLRARSGSVHEDVDHFMADLGSNVHIGIKKEAIPAIKYNKKSTFKGSLPEEMKFESDGVEVTAKRTPVCIEKVEDIMDELPDQIRETISRLLDA